MYRSESLFSRAFVKAVNSTHGMWAQRIETGSIGRGVPDVFIICAKGIVPVELKNLCYAQLNDLDKVVVPWRPGQKAWHLKYHMYTNRTVYTVVALYDHFLVIPMNKVSCGTGGLWKREMECYSSLKEVINRITHE